jgi:hypothetical protein
MRHWAAIFMSDRIMDTAARAKFRIPQSLAPPRHLARRLLSIQRIGAQREVASQRNMEGA